jgi:hypothetical protein
VFFVTGCDVVQGENRGGKSHETITLRSGQISKNNFYNVKLCLYVESNTQLSSV